MNVQRSGIINFDSIDERDEWLDENFPVNVDRIKNLKSHMAKGHAVILQPNEKKFLFGSEPYSFPGVKMNLAKEAKKDAEEFARAQMFFGEGAGTRRKLIEATVNHKDATVPGYRVAFMEAFSKQDMAQHAKLAKKERKRIDTTNSVEKNIKKVVRGDWRKLDSTALVVVGLAAYYAHQTGLDRQALDYSKKKYRELKRKYRARKNNITSI